MNKRVFALYMYKYDTNHIYATEIDHILIMNVFWKQIPTFGKIYLIGAVVTAPISAGFRYRNNLLITEQLEKLNATSRVTDKYSKVTKGIATEILLDTVFWIGVPFSWYRYYEFTNGVLNSTVESVKIIDIKLNLVEIIEAMPQDETHLGGALTMLQHGHDK